MLKVGVEPHGGKKAEAPGVLKVGVEPHGGKKAEPLSELNSGIEPLGGNQAKSAVDGAFEAMPDRMKKGQDLKAKEPKAEVRSLNPVNAETEYVAESKGKTMHPATFESRLANRVRTASGTDVVLGEKGSANADA